MSARLAAARIPEGKRLLMRAATRLAARQGSARTLVLREVAREAGLNHNTLYRHFESLDALMCDVIQDFGRELRAGLTRARQSAPPDEPISPHVVSWLFDFARQHPDTFIVAMRERYGPPGPLRDEIRGVLEQLRLDMARELGALERLPALDAAQLDRNLRVLIDQGFQACLDYLEAPRRRRELLEASRELFDTLMAGAMILSSTE